MISTVLVLLSSLFGPMTWDNLNSYDEWDCYTVEGKAFCQTELSPCHYQESVAECTVVVALSAGENRTRIRPCQSRIPGCTIETWSSPVLEVADANRIARPLYPDIW